jgi:hypothetical protein
MYSLEKHYTFTVKALENFYQHNKSLKDNRGTLLVAQLVEALRCKSDGRGFDSRWCYWNFSLT